MEKKTSLKLTEKAPENAWLEVGILVSFWDCVFSGAMVVLGRVVRVKKMMQSHFRWQ